MKEARKVFHAPEATVVWFDAADVISTSGGGFAKMAGGVFGGNGSTGNGDVMQ